MLQKKKSGSTKNFYFVKKRLSTAFYVPSLAAAFSVAATAA